MVPGESTAYRPQRVQNVKAFTLYIAQQFLLWCFVRDGGARASIAAAGRRGSISPAAFSPRLIHARLKHGRR
jgi:hypothetical protein